MLDKLCTTSDPALRMCAICQYKCGHGGRGNFLKRVYCCIRGFCIYKNVWEASYRGRTKRLELPSLVAVTAAFVTIEEDDKFNASRAVPQDWGAFKVWWISSAVETCF